MSTSRVVEGYLIPSSCGKGTYPFSIAIRAILSENARRSIASTAQCAPPTLNNKSCRTYRQRSGAARFLMIRPQRYHREPSVGAGN